LTILIVGGGAVGSFLAWALATGGQDVWLVRRGHDGPPARRDVVVVDPQGERRTSRVTVIDAPERVLAEPEAILFTVKMYDLPAAIESCQRWSVAGLITVQNGIGAEEIAAGARPDPALVAASVTAAVEPSADGGWRWLRTGGVGLAPVRGAGGPIIGRLSQAFGAAGLPVRTFGDAPAMKWSKLLGNLIGNATAAILDMDVGAIYREPGLFRVERAQILEALAVMDALGLRVQSLPGADVRLLVRALGLPEGVARPVLARVLARARGGKDPSLLLHVRSRAVRSEVEWMNGAVARVGEATGIATPVNHRLTELVSEVSGNHDRRAWFRHRPDRLLAAIAESAV
jgi:2-dehydropantoate 2-reductase